MSSSVVVFPLHRQQKLLRGVANELRSKQGELATLFWRETAQSLLRHLAENGIDLPAAEAQVRAFFYAVLAEVEADAFAAKG
jgi:hypothetical protein